MKLIRCGNCGDVYNVTFGKKTCSCEKTWACYEPDGLHATYGGEHAIPIGFLNRSFLRALYNRPTRGQGRPFIAFVIPRECETFIKEE